MVSTDGQIDQSGRRAHSHPAVNTLHSNSARETAEFEPDKDFWIKWPSAIQLGFVS